MYVCSDHILIYYTDITAVLQKVPDLHDLLNLLQNIAKEWYIIGVLLKVDENFLRGLLESVQDDTTKLHKVLTRWMDTMSSPITWQNIVNLVEGPFIANHSTAEEICEFLSQQDVYSKYQGMQSNYLEKVKYIYYYIHYSNIRVLVFALMAML